MATKPLTLSGLVEPTTKAANQEAQQEWRRKEQQLEEEILGLRRELDDAHSQNEKLERSLRTLRKQLSPLHLALRAVFGEIELAVGAEDFPISSASSPATSPSGASEARWESYKNNFPGAAAKIIDVLLAHPSMSITQISGMLRMHYNTAKDALLKLKKAGAVVSVGGNYSLNR